ncbi:MAG: chromate transporter, partial [Lachnospiraceae bacterium]
IISFGYTAFRDSVIVNNVLRGMQAGVAAVIVDVVISMGWDLIKNKKVLPILVMIGAFVAACIFNVNVMIIIIACGLIGAVDILFKRGNKEALTI